MKMSDSITVLSGVGPKLQERLMKLGINTVGDLVRHFPRRYEDYSHIQKIAQAKPGPLTLEVEVSSVTGRYARRGLHITEAVLSDNTGQIRAVWFNQPYRSKQLVAKQRYFCSGSYEFSNNRYVLMNPALERVEGDAVNSARIVPIYPETAGLKSHQLRKLVAKLPIADLIETEEIPYEITMTRREALRAIHMPQSMGELRTAQDYFEFEELFTFILTSLLIRRGNQTLHANEFEIHEDVLKEWVSSLPFKLTNAQRKVAWQELQDMNRAVPMNRLVQGDVGSGKTVVAALVALNTILGKSQVAILAPTEVLAKQHFRNFEKLFAASSIRTELLIGSTKSADKKTIKSLVAKHEVDLVVGTHALLQSDIAFSSLGLVVIDEQHRFGVEQRMKLTKSKRQPAPHLLSMSATPIPRTLALTVFGDLDISVIDEMPAGRKPVKTKVVSPNSLATVFEKVAAELEAGKQAFIIYPLVEESEKMTLKSVTAEYQKLQRTVFKKWRVGLLHGQLKSIEKDAVMREFSSHKLDILFATTVIEVGVDVPNATIMVIEGAERFGLAQLHQLRGRVGRGDDQAYCYLVPSTSQGVSKRLRALESTNDGFKLAEFDLSLRGPGAIYGTMQHGELDLDVAKLSDTKLIAKAQDFAQKLIDDDPELEGFPQLRNKVAEYRRVTHLN